MNEISMDRPERLSINTLQGGGQSMKAKSAYQESSVAQIDSGKVSPEAETKGNEMAAAEPEKVQEAVSRINEYVQQSERSLEFRMDDTSGRTVIRVYDKQSEELIRQMPSELALELAQKLNDEEPSLLFSAQV